LVAIVSCQLTAHIQLSKHTYHAGEELLVNWSLATEEPVHIVTFGTPLEGEWNANMFRINSFSLTAASSTNAEYQGRVYKRVTPTLADYTEVLPETPRTGQLVLSEGYKFYTRGTYTVTMHLVVVPLAGEPFIVESNTVELVVTEPNIREQSQIGNAGRVTFNGCSSTEQSTVNTAISNAVSASANAEAYLNKGGSASSSAYTKWFGTYNSDNWSTVTTHFVNINNLLSSSNFGIDCTCNQPGTYAYVYPSDPKHTIYLCPVFWTASTSATQYNSQPGTLTHESSHFNDIAGTGDYQYGVPGCMELASNPSVAIKNADSHEYFQESNP